MKVYDEEIKIKVERWKNMLVGYVVRSKPCPTLEGCSSQGVEA